MNSNSSSIARILNDNIDLSEEKYDSNNIEDFWNESVQSIMNYWKNAFTIGWLSSDITIDDNPLQFKIEEIKKLMQLIVLKAVIQQNREFLKILTYGPI